MKPRHPGIRAAGLAAVLATAAALMSAPAAYADPGAGSGSDGGSGHAVRLTPDALKKLSARYTPRTDGTPGLVASAQDPDGTAGGSADSTTGPEGTPQAAPEAPKTSKSSAAPKAPATAGATDAADATDAAGSTGFQEEASWETARGAASTLALAGTSDWVAVYSGGGLTRYDAAGKPVWQRTSHSLYTDWQVKPADARQAEEFSPVMFQGYNPYQPSALGTHPFAQADFTHDGVADVAVAYSVGASPARPFTSPGSDLQSGTFVSVLDGRSGAMLWHTLLPGDVGSLTVQDGTLVAAQATGPNWYDNPVAEQGDSRSSLIGFRLRAGAKGTLTGGAAWTYSTKAPWALWSDVEPAGDGLVTAGWTDTPMGLGNPRPPAGHVVVVDAATGKVRTDVKTPGYPRIVQRDPATGRVLVAEQNDPLDAVRWDLTTIDVTSGRRSVLATRTGTIPEALVANPGAHGKQPAYALAELGINADLSDGQSSVAALDQHGRTTWTYRTASTIGGYNAPTLSLALDTSGSGQVVAAVADAAYETNARPEAPAHSQLVALDARGGGVRWRREGAVVGDQVTPYRGGLLTVGYDLTAYRVDPGKGTATALPLLGDMYGGVATDVNGDGTKDLVVGGQSHGVFALDGRSLKSATPTVLWTTPVDGSVRQLTLAAVADSKGRVAQRLVAATSLGFAVLQPRDGKVTGQVTTGVFQPGVTVADGHVVASGAALTAYTADGSQVWSYRPAGTAGKTVLYSVPATAEHRLYVEYGGARDAFGTGASDPEPTAVALDPATGKQLWSTAPSSLAASWIERQAGVFASPAIPAADGHAVAFAFGGDQPSSRAHLVEIVDGRTGEVVSTDEATGSPTFQGFAASPTYGLVELHTNLMTVYPADGSAPFRVRTMANVWQAVFAAKPDGAEEFVAGWGGVGAYDLPFPTDDSQYDEASAEVFALFGANVLPVELGAGGAGGKGTELLALQRDWSAYDLNQQVGGFGADSFAIDSYQHGVSVERLTAPSAAKAAPHEAAPRGAATEDPAKPLDIRTLPIGRAAVPLHVQQTLKAQDGATDAETTVGYTPQQIRARLGLTGDGSGQTVAITVAYDYPTAEADLDHFADHFGLPQTCGSAAKGADCFDFTQVYAEGTKPAADANWSEEAALDIEWAHSVAPKARIVLVEAADASAAALDRAIDTAASYHPAAVNNSWGMPEFSEESFFDGHCRLTGSVCTQSTGDAGYPAGYSSTNPYAIAVGGTHLVLDADGATRSETAWAATGGGLSYFEPRPAYQDGVQPSTFRATPDVSFVADPRTGVAVYTSAGGDGQWLEVGGTSLSSPIWAGVLTVADQLRTEGGKQPLTVAGPAGDTAHAAVYALGTALGDVTAGSNGLCGAECTAGPGYDTVTGLGSPLPGIDKALAARP